PAGALEILTAAGVDGGDLDGLVAGQPVRQEPGAAGRRAGGSEIVGRAGSERSLRFYPARRLPSASSPSGTTVPASPSTVTRSPSRSALVAPATPNAAGIPSSRATIAAWHMIPPTSI